ncbi:MAG: DNA polymerase III subunit delta [Zoogloeaceae bacterium]|jgi:DNA polymerase-3 subunit delta|nr:DNA polymerase III subunit delta [Zoogloeaceae bacterium]
MLLKGEQLAAHLEGALKRLYVVYGDAPLLVLEAADAIRAAARAHGYADREILTVLPGFDWGTLAAATGNLSLFGSKTLVDLRIPGGKPGKEGSAALAEHCARMHPESLLLITLPELDWKEEKAAWFTALRTAGVVLKLDAPSLAELPGWIAGRLARQRREAEEEGLRFMAERVEGNLLAAHQEIQKLTLLYPVGKLTSAQIRDAVLNVARYRVDDLREALVAGDLARLARTLEGLRQEGEAPPLVLWAMAEEIRALARLKAGLQRGGAPESLFRELHIWGVRQGQMRRAATAIRGKNLQAALKQAALLDRASKGLSGGSGNVWEGFLRLGLTLWEGAEGRKASAGRRAAPGFSS